MHQSAPLRAQPGLPGAPSGWCAAPATCEAASPTPSTAVGGHVCVSEAHRSAAHAPGGCVCAGVTDARAWAPQRLLRCGGLGACSHACRHGGRWQHLGSPSPSQSAGAGSRPPHAARLYPLIVPLFVSCLCAENWWAQVLLCTSTHAAAPAHDEATRSSRGAALTTGASAADVSGSAHRWWCYGDRHGHIR